MKDLHRIDFLKELKEAFPQLQNEVNQQFGLLHLEMHTFCDFTQAAIDNGDKDDVIACFRIADKYVRYGNARIVNACVVSYLEHLNFNDGKVQRSWAKRILTPTLREYYDDVMAYLRKLDEKNEN